MVKIEINNKTGSYAQNIKIRQGYYPARVIAINEYRDKDKNLVNKVLKDGTIGHQLMIKFAVYHADQETGAPTKPVIFKQQVPNGPTIEEEVTLANFVFYEYEKKDPKTGTMVKTSALTPQTNAGRVFIALGYDFNSKEAIDTDKFIGKWTELNIADYEKTEADGTKVIKSVIKDVSAYRGPSVDIKIDKASEMTEDDIEVLDL